MEYFPAPLEKLVEQFARLPGIGGKSAQRLAFHVLGLPEEFAPTFEPELQPTLVAKGPGAIQSGYTVRRLTPTECARLQGFPDWWCDDLGIEPTTDDLRYWYDVFETQRRIVGSSSKPKSLKQIAKWLRDPHSDAAEYKMWGNGVALPCVVFVLSGIVWCTQNETENSRT